MAIYNLFNEDLRAEIGFFGTPLTTNALTVIMPYTNAGGSVISNSPLSYGSTTSTWGSKTGAWVNWTPSSSIIPSSAKVTYAFLVWSSVYYPGLTPPYEVITTLPNIIFTKPDGSNTPIVANPLYFQTFSASNNWYQYTKGADITSLMLDNQHGKYMVTNVPAGNYGGSNGIASWGVYILYQDESFLYRNVNLNVAATGFNQTLTITNLVVPITGPVNCKIFLSSVQGDLGYPDSLLLNGQKISGPFNPINDFMNDKFVDYTGLALQTIGSLLNQNIGLSQYGYYADQTLISNNTILTNTTTTVTITQVNSGDWAGISFLGVMTALNSATLNPAHKNVDKNYALPGDTITYTLTFTNVGSVNTMDTFIIDTLPNNLTLNPNSLTLNSLPYNGDITQGITLPDINPNSTITLSFSATVNLNTQTPTQLNNTSYIAYNFFPSALTLVNTSLYTNYVTTTIISVSLVATKYVDKLYSSPGDTLTYTITLNNLSSQAIYQIQLLDTLSNNLSPILNSFKQDSTPFSYSTSLMTLPNVILSNNISTITYQAVITNRSVNPIPNISTVVALSSISNLIYSTSGQTNVVNTYLPFVDLTIIKSVDHFYASPSTTLTYTVTIVNNGNTPAFNLYFHDTIPNGVSFIPNSFTLDGVTLPGVNPQTATNIGSINPNNTITITFQVVVN
ncbi:MAG: DUF11 domain-containing protein [Clostridium sp.]